MSSDLNSALEWINGNTNRMANMGAKGITAEFEMNYINQKMPDEMAAWIDDQIKALGPADKLARLKGEELIYTQEIASLEYELTELTQNFTIDTGISSDTRDSEINSQDKAELKKTAKKQDLASEVQKINSEIETNNVMLATVGSEINIANAIVEDSI